ncbi:MAG: hypothetical protein R2780_06670 [Crocinitomicaceae bacterium]
MKHLFTFLTACLITGIGFGQVIFQNDMSTWSGGIPTGWSAPVGVTSLEADSIKQNSLLPFPITPNYGTDMASCNHSGRVST